MPGISSLAVWVADKRSGLIARERRQEYVFAYSQVADNSAQVSLTMPVRLESWVSRELHPIFQMNLPEGALLEVIRRSIAKLVGDDDLAILRVTGGNQVGRNRFSLPATSRHTLRKLQNLWTNCLPIQTPEIFSTNWWPDMPSVPGFRESSRRSCWRPRNVAR